LTPREREEVAVTDQNEPTPAAAAVRAFRLRMAGAAGVALLLTFVLLVWASPGPPADAPTGPSTTLTLAPPPEPAGGPAADPPPPDEEPTEPIEEPEPAPEVEPPPATPEPDEAEDPAEQAAADDPVPPTAEPGPGAPLWGRWYRAVHLRQGDQTAVVAGDRPLYVGFLRDPDRDGIVWMTSCNTFGADLTVEEGRLRLAELGGSAADCDDENLAEQELWLLELFAEDPNWRHVGGRLRLWSDDRRIDLVEDARGPGPPWT
jgi:hypothetical protein